MFADLFPKNKDVIEAFHASEKHTPWTQCNGTVGYEMMTPESRPAVELLPALLEQVDILFFAGENDMMCNWLGGLSSSLGRAYILKCTAVERSLNLLEWGGSKGFGVSDVHPGISAG